MPFVPTTVREAVAIGLLRPDFHGTSEFRTAWNGAARDERYALVSLHYSGSFSVRKSGSVDEIIGLSEASAVQIALEWANED